MMVVENVKEQASNLREKAATGLATPRQRRVLKWAPLTGVVLGTLVVGLVVAEGLTLWKAMR